MYFYLPNTVVEWSGVSGHYFRPIPIFVKDLVQDCFLLEAIDIVRCLRCDKQVLLLTDKSIVRRLGHLMLLLRSTIVYLLEQVVLLLTHHQLPSFLLPLFQLVFEGLGIDAHTSIRHDLLACVRGNADSHTSLAHALDARVEREQVVLQVYDLDVWLWKWPAHHVLFVKAPLVGDVVVLVDRGRHAGGGLLLDAAQRFLRVVPEGTRSRAGLVPQHHDFPPALLLRGMRRC